MLNRKLALHKKFNACFWIKCPVTALVKKCSRKNLPILRWILVMMGKRAINFRLVFEKVKSGRCISHCGVRWKTETLAPVLINSGMACAAVDPVPITPTRVEADMSTLWFHWAVWNVVPLKSFNPGMSGNCGWCKMPVAHTIKSAI